MDALPTLDFLRSEFTRVTRQFQGDEEIARTWSNSLIQAYTEPQRHYHTTTHISAMLRLFQTHQHLVSNPLVVQLAIFFHDWVYDPTARDNEAQSVAVFETFAAQLDMPTGVREKVRHYIEATITHSLSSGGVDDSDEDMKLFLDFDLEVLGRRAGEYRVYARQIREEYSHFSDDEYAKGRVAVLEKLLRRDRLYFSEELGAELETRARENLGAEIEGLRAGKVKE